MKAHALGAAPDAAGDSVVLEATAEEIGTAGDKLRYVSVSLKTDDAADNIAVTYIRSGRVKKTGLTADSIA